MKGIFGLVGLLLALAIVGVVVKKQLDTSSQGVPAMAPAVSGGAASAPATTVREQSQQVQQQYKQAVEGLIQQPRPMPDEK
jgi:hypothetical protein